MEKYLTKTNAQFIALFGAFIAPIYLLVKLGLNIASVVLPFLHVILRFFYFIITYVSYGVCIVSIVTMIYMISKNEEKNMYFVGLSAALLSFVSIYSSYNRGSFTFFFLFAILLGVDMFIKVFLTADGFDSDVDFKGDIEKAKLFYENYKIEKENQAKLDQEMAIHTTTINDSPIKSDNGAYGESYFDGDALQVIGNYLILVVVSLVTCGIATPWALTNIVKWRVSHTTVDGKRMDFNGSGHQLFGLWIKWWLLTLITCGIYSYFAYVDYMKWELKHTYFIDEGYVEKDSAFDGNSFEYLGYSILTSVLMTITCLIATPWTMVILEKWLTSHQIVSKRRLYFDGTGIQFFFKFLVLTILTVITCGLFIPWAVVEYQKWIVSHTHINKTSNMY